MIERISHLPRLAFVHSGLSTARRASRAIFRARVPQAQPRGSAIKARCDTSFSPLARDENPRNDMAYNPHGSSTNLLGNLEGQISADDDSAAEQGRSRAYELASHSQGSNAVSGSMQSTNANGQPPAARGSVNVNGVGSTDANESIWQQSAHPVALFCLFFFRSAAIATYLLCGFFVSSYVFSVRT